MAAASSKLHSPLWTPSTGLSEAQQKSWPEAHYLSNAPSLTDRRGRAHAGTPCALCLTGQKPTRTGPSHPFQTHLRAFQLEKCLLGDRSQPGYSNRAEAGNRVTVPAPYWNVENVMVGDVFLQKQATLDTTDKGSITSWFPGPTISTFCGCATGDHNDSQQIDRVYGGVFTCHASEKQAWALTTHT